MCVPALASVSVYVAQDACRDQRGLGAALAALTATAARPRAHALGDHLGGRREVTFVSVGRASFPRLSTVLDTDRSGASTSPLGCPRTAGLSPSAERHGHTDIAAPLRGAGTEIWSGKQQARRAPSHCLLASLTHTFALSGLCTSLFNAQDKEAVIVIVIVIALADWFVND